MNHPTRQDERVNIRLKQQIADRVKGKYVFAFDPKDYCDFEVFNILGNPTRASKEFIRGFQTLYRDDVAKPVVFFLCYDVGFKKELEDQFIRHVVCCIASRNGGDTVHLMMFDMRNLREISNDLREVIEKELGRVTKKPSHIRLFLTNNACVDRKTCVYLQRFKGLHEMGWCIAWASFFLDAAIARPIWNGKYAYELTFDKQKEAFAEIYRLVDAELRRTQTNGFIEDWYTLELGL
jgi:hypothetical protein